jgi:hypothetical protein
MRKIIVLSTFLLLFGLGNIKADAGGCSVTCRFSSCTIGGVDTWACGCYFGIASCKGEKIKASPNKQSINDFGDFARNSGSVGLMRLSNVLNNLNEDNYSAQLEIYRSQVENLKEDERGLLIAYLGGTY